MNSQTRIILLSVLNSVIGAVIVFSCIATFMWRIAFSIVFFSIAFLLQLALLGFDPQTRISRFPQFRDNKNISLFMVAILGTIVVIITPFDVKITGNTILTTFMSLPLSGLFRVFFGYFLVCFFPGYVILTNLMNTYEFNFLERIGLSLALSYAISNIIGFILLKLGVELNAYSILFSIWAFTLVFTLGRCRVRTKPITKIRAQSSGLSLLKYCILLCIGASLVFSFYTTTLNAAPFAGVFCSDIPEYMNVLNQFLVSPVSQRSAYPSWVAFHVWIIHWVVNLPLLHTYAGFQFYIFLVPISIYFLFRTLFPRHENSAAIATALVSIFAGLNSLGILRLSVDNYYANPASALDILQEKIGWKSLVAFHINGYTILQAGTFEGVFSLLALAFAYRYFKTKKPMELLFCSFFMSVALFSHNIMLFLCLCVTIALFSLANKFYGTLAKICLVTFAFLVFFDFLSKDYFKDLLLAIYLSQIIGPYKSVFSPYEVIMVLVVLVISIMLLVGVVKYICKIEKYAHILGISFCAKTKNHSSSLLWGLGCVIVLLSFVIWNASYTSFTMNSTSAPYPWYFQIIYYGMIFLFAVGTLAIVVKKAAKFPLLFVCCWVCSVLFAMFLGFLVPNFLKPEIWTLRLASFLAYPMACLAAFGIFELFRLIRSRANWRVTYLSIFLLILILVPSFLSYSYDTEFWYYAGFGQPPHDSEALEWMYNNLSKNACVLTLSESSYKEVTNLASRRAIPLLSFYSWPQLILSYSKLPEDVLCMLNNIGVTHVYVTTQDMQIGGFKALFSLLDCFDLVHETDSARVFQIPKYPLYEDSNYVLVSSIFDNKNANYFDAFKMLLFNKLNFSIVNDVDMEHLLPGNVYFFPDNQQIPNRILDRLIPAVRGGSHIVFMSPEFATIDEFGIPVDFEYVLVNKTQALSSNYETAHAIVFDDGSKITLETDLTIRRIHVDESNVNVLSYFELDNGSLIPFIAQQHFGKGSITFINLPPTQNSVAEKAISTNALKVLANSLSKPNSPNKPLALPYPSKLYDFLTPWELNLYKLKELYGFLLCNGEVVFSGCQRIDSAYIYVSTDVLHVKNLTFTYDGKTESIHNVVIKNLTILGQGSVFSQRAQISLRNPPNLYNVFTTGGFESTSCFNNSRIKLEISSGGVTRQINSSDANISITSMDSCAYITYKPTLWMNGTAECAIQGGLQQDGGFFYALPHVSNQFATFVPVMLKGTFSMQFVYSSGLLIQQTFNVTKLEASFVPEVTKSWWDTQWKYRMKLLLNNSWLGKDLVDFPILVSLSSSSFNFSKAESNGADIRFTNSDGITLLNYEIETWDYTTDHAHVWVLIPEIRRTGTPEYIYMYYGNAEAEDAQNTKMVWVSNYIMVNHFQGNASISSVDTIIDSTSHHNNGKIQSINATSILGEGGKIGTGLSLNGVGDKVIVPSDPSLEPNEFTCEVWIRPISQPSYSERIVEKDSPWINGWRFEVFSSKPLSAAFCVVDANYGNKYLGFSYLHLNEWTFLTGVFKAGYMATYVNGELQQVDTNVSVVCYGGEYLTIGADHSFSALFNGTMDELRISNVAYSKAWIKAQYLSMTDALIVFGIEEISK